MAEICSLCGKAAAGDTLPLDWTLDFNERGMKAVCSECTRSRLRDIEGKFDLDALWAEG